MPQIIDQGRKIFGDRKREGAIFMGCLNMCNFSFFFQTFFHCVIFVRLNMSVMVDFILSTVKQWESSVCACLFMNFFFVLLIYDSFRQPKEAFNLEFIKILDDLLWKRCGNLNLHPELFSGKCQTIQKERKLCFFLRVYTLLTYIFIFLVSLKYSVSVILVISCLWNFVNRELKCLRFELLLDLCTWAVMSCCLTEKLTILNLLSQCFLAGVKEWL